MCSATLGKLLDPYSFSVFFCKMMVTILQLFESAGKLLDIVKRFNTVFDINIHEVIVKINIRV